MYNPYLSSIGAFLRPVTRQRSGSLFGGILNRLRHLDEDDLLLILILFFLMKNGDKEGQWPLLAAIVYCML